MRIYYPLIYQIVEIQPFLLHAEKAQVPHEIRDIILSEFIGVLDPCQLVRKPDEYAVQGDGILVLDVLGEDVYGS